MAVDFEKHENRNAMIENTKNRVRLVSVYTTYPMIDKRKKKVKRSVPRVDIQATLSTFNGLQANNKALIILKSVRFVSALIA